MPTQNVNLPDHQAEFIRSRIAQGRYQNASEVVRAGLRLLEHAEEAEELRLRALQRIAKDSFAAFERGEYQEYTVDQLTGLFDEIDQETRVSDQP